MISRRGASRFRIRTRWRTARAERAFPHKPACGSLILFFAEQKMEDAFSLFSLERRPLIDEAALKEKYLRLAATRHPDLSGGNDEKFHLLQDAYKTLREP